MRVSGVLQYSARGDSDSHFRDRHTVKTFVWQVPNTPARLLVSGRVI